MRSLRVLCIVFLLLTACRGSSDDAEFTTIRGAQSGVRSTAETVKRSETEEPPIPAAIAGLLAGGTMGQGISEVDFPGPIDGADDILGTRADTELLGALVKLLDTDVMGILNAAQNREDTLQTYIDSLSTHAQKGHIRLRTMQDDVNRSTDEKKRAERRIRELRYEISTSIGNGDTNRVSVLTDELVQKQKILGKADSDIIVKEYLTSAYEDVLTPIGERLDAMNANRDALIKGVKVIEMPGVEELKILEYKDGKVRLGTRKSFF